MKSVLRSFTAVALLAGSPSFVYSQRIAAPAMASGGLEVREAIPEGLNLATLEQIALERNPTLVQAGAQVHISRGKALQAGLYPNPTIGFAAEQIGVEGTAGEFHGGFIEQQIITGGKLRLSRAKFAQEARQAQLQVLAQQYRVMHGVRMAYYHAMTQQRRVQLRSQLLQNADEVVETVRELVNVGQANRADLLQAQVRLQRAQANLHVAERRDQGAWEELVAVIGMPELPRSALQGELELDGSALIDRDAALENLLACSPQLRFVRAEVERDRIALQRERVEPIPNLSVRAETGYNYEAEDTVAGIEVGFRLPLFDKNQGTIIQARSELSRAHAEVARTELMLRQRFAEAFTEYESAVLLANSYREETLPIAEEAYGLYWESFQKKRAAWPQVLDAQREYYELYEEYLDQVLEARRAETRINAMFLEDGLSQPPSPTPEGHRDATPRPR